MMKTLTIQLSTQYTIYIDNNLLSSNLLLECCAQLNKRMVIITDNHLEKLYAITLQHFLAAHGLNVRLFSFPAGEKHKTRETKQMLEDELFQHQYGRDTCLIALGGGIVTDLVGFLAATYCRGIPVIYIPTTLLAMVDASIGGKTGVNTPLGKNLIGSFTQPHAIFIDPSTLKTLPAQEWHNGTVEMIKHSVMVDAELFLTLQKNVATIKQQDSDFLINMIYTNCLIKNNIVSCDEKEQGMRQLLNFGHTIGHAIETIERYHISHGEAVALGMLVESYIAFLMGIFSENELISLEELLLAYGLPLKSNAFLNKQALIDAMKLDKKAIANIPQFVLLDKIGQVHRRNNSYTIPVDTEILEQALDWAARKFSL